MFNWLRNWLLNRNRLLFRYWDGQRIRRGDPIVLWRNLMTDKRFDFKSCIERQNNETYFAFPNEVFPVPNGATQECAIVIRDSFGIPEFGDSQGLSENELIALGKSFLEYVHFLKKSISLSQTSAEQSPGSSILSFTPSVPPEPGMKPTAEPTSILIGPEADCPLPSATVGEPSFPRI